MLPPSGMENQILGETTNTRAPNSNSSGSCPVMGRDRVPGGQRAAARLARAQKSAGHTPAAQGRERIVILHGEAQGTSTVREAPCTLGDTQNPNSERPFPHPHTRAARITARPRLRAAVPTLTASRGPQEPLPEPHPQG